MPDLIVLVRRLAAARVAHERHAARLADLEAGFRRRHADELAAAATARQALEAADAAVRTEALAVYAATGAKAPGPGVTVQVRHGIRYDVEQAFAWVLRQKNRRDFLQLDDRALKARAAHDLTGLDFAQQVELPTVLIATHLGPALKGWKP